MQTFVYSYHGLVIESEYYLPELITCQDPSAIEAQIRKVSEIEIFCPIVPGQRFYEISPSQHFFQVEGIAKYMISGGREIIIEEYNGVREEEIRAYLVSHVWNILINQLGKILFHGCSLHIGPKVIFITGRSLYPRSILGQELEDKGFMLLSDSFSCIELIDDNPMVLSGISPYRFKLDEIIFLQTTTQDHFVKRQLAGIEKVSTLLECIFYNELSKGQTINNFDLASSLAKKCKFTKIEMPETNFTLEKLLDYFYQYHNS